jgi:hypothetical protein
MSILTFILLLVISSVGLFTGLVLCYVAFEELEFNSLYFKIMQISLLVLILNLFTYLNNSKFDLFICLITIIIIGILKFKYSKSTEIFDYAILGIVIGLCSDYTNFLKLIVAAVFLYGFPTAALLVINTKLTKKQIFSKMSNMSKLFQFIFAFLILSLTLYIFF